MYMYVYYMYEQASGRIYTINESMTLGWYQVISTVAQESDTSKIVHDSIVEVDSDDRMSFRQSARTWVSCDCMSLNLEL